MTDPKKPPVVVGNIDTTNDPIANYQKKLQERAAKARAEKQAIGNLAQANEAYSYDHRQKNATTIANIVESNRVAESPGDGTQAPAGPRPLSQDSVVALKAIAEAAEASRRQKAAEAPPQTPQKPAAPKPVAKKEPMENKERKDIAPNPDDANLDFEELIKGVQRDVIDNVQERNHVNDPANKRLSEIDFGEGIARGEFRQVVEIVPGKLKATFRTVTSMEDQAVKLWVFKKVTEDAILDKVSVQMYSMAMVAAGITHVGSVSLPDHLKRQGDGTYNAEFDDDAFEIKYRMLTRMPLPLIHSLATHYNWFDIRTRQMFTTDFVKNG